MNRKDFLKNIGLTSFGLSLSTPVLAKNKASEGENCTLIPSETAGPFPLDLSANTFYLRQDIREDRTGVPLQLNLKINGLSDCEALPNVRVNVWHCDKDGNYSGYGNQANFKYLRGYQMTDANGEVQFMTILPGWYDGRVCHIHFQVHVSASYAAISQFTFDPDIVNIIYRQNDDLYTRGEVPITPEADNVFSDGYQSQNAILEPNSSGYKATLTVNVEDSTVGLSHSEKETAKHLTLSQNYPNPFEKETTIPFVLKKSALVNLELWNIQGQKLKVMDLGRLSAGNHHIKIDLQSLGLAPANYLYQIEIQNNNGVYKSCKMMTHR